MNDGINVRWSASEDAEGGVRGSNPLVSTKNPLRDSEIFGRPMANIAASIPI